MAPTLPTHTVSKLTQHTLTRTHKEYSHTHMYMYMYMYTLHRTCGVCFQLLTRVSGVHTVFVTGLVFIPLHSKATATSSVKQVSKPEKLVLISVSADRTCSGTLVRKKSGRFMTSIIHEMSVHEVHCLLAIS